MMFLEANAFWVPLYISHKIHTQLAESKNPGETAYPLEKAFRNNQENKSHVNKQPCINALAQYL